MRIMKTKRFKSENGVVTIIVALSIVALMMVTALTIDVGSLYEERRHLQTVADAAALAGAQELPENVNAAVEKAIEYASRCGVNINLSDVEISFTLAEDDTITVNAINPNAELYFARVIGMSETQVAASATAIVASPKEYVGVVPWGIPYEEYIPGIEYVLKFGSGPVGESYSGNFQPLDLDIVDECGPCTGGGGGAEYKYDIIHGSDTPLEVWDFVCTETGNKTGPTEQAVETRVYDYNNFKMDLFDVLVGTTPEGYELVTPDSQFIIIPIILDLVDFHGTQPIQIIAFAPFIITDFNDMYGDEDFGNGISIEGTFLNEAFIISEGGVIPVESEGIKVIRLID